MKNNETENVDLYYLPGSKYDTVEELSDGNIKINPYSKKFYNFLFTAVNKIFHYNSITGCVSFSENPSSGYRILNISNSALLKGRTGIARVDEYFCFFNPVNGNFEFYDNDFRIVKTLTYPGSTDNFTFHDGRIIIYDRNAAVLHTFIIQGESLIHEKDSPVKGIGNKSLFVTGNDIWITDTEENLVYVYSYNDFVLRFQLITPFFDPQALVIHNKKIWVLYGGEVNESSYGQRCWAEQKPFFHILKYRLFEKEGFNYSLTNTFRTEFSYEENLVVDKKLSLPELNIFMSLPLNTVRQELLGYEILGCEGKEISPGKIHISLKDISSDSSGSIGYRAFLKLSSVKYSFFRDHPSAVLPDGYIIPGNEKLMTDHRVMRELASLPECGIIEGMLTLRNRVFDKLFYKQNMWARDYVEVLQDGFGTCGDYSSIILSLAIINGFPIRTCGGFKVPRFINSQQDNRSCYYNHTWLEVFIPDAGWVPFESSTDDREFNARLCEGQFLGEDWSHIRTHYDRSVPNLISAVSGNENIHPYDLFENNSFMKITGEYPLPENE